LEGKKLKILELADNLEKSCQENADQQGKSDENNLELKEKIKLLEAEAKNLEVRMRLLWKGLKLQITRKLKRLNAVRSF
jgi:hypothetical protein